jgi:hypothetical protein
VARFIGVTRSEYRDLSTYRPKRPSDTGKCHTTQKCSMRLIETWSSIGLSRLWVTWAMRSGCGIQRPGAEAPQLTLAASHCGTHGCRLVVTVSV